MPCYTQYQGKAAAVKPPFKRTQLTIDQQMTDEYGGLHGTIKTVNTKFKELGHHAIEASLYNNGCAYTNQWFLLVEQEGDREACNANGWIAVEPEAGQSAEEAMLAASQSWLTYNYREYVHNHDKPQDVFIVGGN